MPEMPTPVPTPDDGRGVSPSDPGGVPNIEVPDDGLDDLNVDLQTTERTRQLLGGLAASGIQFEDGTLESLNLRRVTIQDREILYTQRYEPRCLFCCHPLRDQAEMIWLESGRNVTAVQRFFEEHDGPRSWSSINNHLEQHCDWTLGPAINFFVRVQHREPELAHIRSNDIGFSIDALNSLIADVGRFSLTGDVRQATQVTNAISKLMQTKQGFLKLQSELYGAHARAEARVQAQTQRVVDFMRKLLSVITDQEQKAEIIKLMDEFRRESVM